MSSLADLLEDRKLAAACYDEAMDEFRQGHEWAWSHVQNFDEILTHLDHEIARRGGVQTYVSL